MDLQTIASVIVLIGGVTVAITNILKFFGKPLGFIKKKREEELEREAQHIIQIINETLPNKFYEHDLETRDKYKGDR
ncbi:MAG: hypothetical protein IJD46_00840 [Bacilli bacterium]|nr:hypothetical protein [Bacilli bacterium]